MCFTVGSFADFDVVSGSLVALFGGVAASYSCSSGDALRGDSGDFSQALRGRPGDSASADSGHFWGEFADDSAVALGGSPWGFGGVGVGEKWGSGLAIDELQAQENFNLAALSILRVPIVDTKSVQKVSSGLESGIAECLG